MSVPLPLRGFMPFGSGPGGGKSANSITREPAVSTQQGLQVSARPHIWAPGCLPWTDAKRQEPARPCRFANTWPVGPGCGHAREGHRHPSCFVGAPRPAGSVDHNYPCKPAIQLPPESQTVCLFLSITLMSLKNKTSSCLHSCLGLVLLIPYILFLPTKHNTENSPKHA